jgi:hypothetical protein
VFPLLTRFVGTPSPYIISGTILMAVNPDPKARNRGFLFEPLDTHYSHLAEATVLIDLRRHPRFDTQFPAEATAENGQVVHATITNISRSGLRLEGNRKMLYVLFPDFSCQTGHTPTSLQVDFSVPVGSERNVEVKARCRTVYIRHESNDVWKIGMAFTEFKAGCQALTDYLLLRTDTG